MCVTQVLSIGLLLLAATVAVEFEPEVANETHAEIVGGHAIPITSAPYIVSIRARGLHEAKFGDGHMCGGCVISQRVVCSAAHCFEINNTKPVQYRDSEDFVVVAGVTSINEISEFAVEYLIEKIVGHHQYRPSTLENDIALLFLNDIIPDFSAYIHPLPLAEHPFSSDTLCSITGWGNHQQQLMEAVVPIVPQRLCTFIYMFLPKSQMCAGWLRGGIDACKGDSGGPLVCQDSLAGIISWGVDCGRRFFPGVYTNISYFKPWIEMINSTFNYDEFKPMSRQGYNNNNNNYGGNNNNNNNNNGPGFNNDNDNDNDNNNRGNRTRSAGARHSNFYVVQNSLLLIPVLLPGY